MTKSPTYPLPNVLVIGGCGFLGHHIVNLLLEHHPESTVSVLDLHTNHNRFPNVTYYNGDITDRQKCAEVFRAAKTDVIINTVSPIAGLGGDIYMKVNVEGTKTTLEVAKETGVKAYVYTSSAGVVTDNVADLINVDEGYPFPKAYTDVYSESKAKGEKAVLDMNGTNGVYTCALRVAGLFGPGDRQMIPGMLSVLRNNQTKFQLGSNDNLFDFTYIENAAYAHILAAERLLHQITVPPADPSLAVAGQAFFITNGEPVYFWDFPRAVWAQYNGHVPPSIIKMPKEVGLVLAVLAESYAKIVGKEPGFTRFRVNYACQFRYFNIKKARALLGYETLYSLHDGLAKTIQYLKEQEAKTGEKKDQ